jgi:SagB-type dehydrogenase family enzyme
MKEMWESLPYDQYPAIELPTDYAPLELSLGEAILQRTTPRGLKPASLSLRSLATLLFHCYGVTRDNKNTFLPRPFRTAPSAGAMYPLEIFFHSINVEDIKGGLYHYNPARNNLRLLREGDLSRELSRGLVQQNIPYDASVIFLLTALFERETFKYGDRGYRFTLMEAGHVAQNLDLVATALGLGAMNIGGFFDRDIDAALELDGVTHSTIYLVAVGEPVAGAVDGTVQV